MSTATEQHQGSEVEGRGRSGVVVTGAAQGLGRAIARTLAGQGYSVVGVDVSAAVADLAGELGEACGGLVGDVREPDVIEQACRDAARRGDGLAAAVFNAGVISPGETVSYPLQEWDRVLGVNLRAAFVGAQAVRPHLGDGGTVVMLSSISASRGFAARASYCASKAGVDGLVRSLAMEWGPAGIRVNAVAPGTIATEMQREMIKSGRASTAGYLDRIPLGRVGDPSEIGEAVAFLISPRASYITGVVLPVDGGWASGGLPALADR